MKREEIAAGLGIELGEAQDISSDVAAFRKAGKLIFTSGLVPHEPDGSIARGKVGQDYTRHTCAMWPPSFCARSRRLRAIWTT